MIRPTPLRRFVITGTQDDKTTAKKYEVLEEMTEMFWQAFQREGELARMSDDKIPDRYRYLSDLAKMQGKRQTWEEAIAIYAGWNGQELARYLGDVLADRREAANV